MSSADEVMCVLATRRAGFDAHVPSAPGLYAIWAGESAWLELGLRPADPSTPLYVGKAEDSLRGRDLKTHFTDGRTGSSTVRRSFAALLAASLGLSGVPRNPARPGHFSNFGLSPADDAKLTAWMRSRLALAVWPHDGSGRLADLEAAVLRAWNPPINIAGVNHRWKPRVQAARKRLADQARIWTPAS